MKIARFTMAASIVCCLLNPLCLSAQQSRYPEIGKPMPDFTLTEVAHYSSPAVSLKDFRGKILVLDFWNSNCEGCINSFPRTNRLQQEFGDKVQFLLVGYSDTAIRHVYERFRTKLNLQLPVAYDTAFARNYGIYYYPYVIMIDRNGIVRAITYDIQEQDLKTLLDGKDPGIPARPDAPKNDTAATVEKKFDEGKPFLIDGNGGNDTDFLYRSLLSRWNKTMPYFSQGYFGTYPKNRFLISGCGLEYLYRMAYLDTLWPIPDVHQKYSYGEFWPDILLEVSDSSMFKYDARRFINLYAYSLTVPPDKATKAYMQHLMQRDLENYFGFDVRVEKRKMPCWNLVATPAARERLKTRSDKPAAKGDYIKGFQLIDQPVLQVIRALFAVKQRGVLYFDETGITGNIDLTMPRGTYNFNEALEDLRKNGLDLVRCEKEVKVVVIRDHQ